VSTDLADISVKDLESALTQNAKIVEEGMAKGVKVDGANVELSRDTADQIKAAYDKCTEIKSLIAMKRLTEEVKKYGAEPEGFSAAMAAAASSAGTQSQRLYVPQQRKSFGQMFTESEQFNAMVKAGKTSMDAPFDIDGRIIGNGGYGTKDVFGQMVPDTVNPQGWGPIQFDPIVPRGQRTYRVRDLFPVATTSANLIDFFRVIGFAENNGNGNAQAVADRAVENSVAVFGPKPKSSLQFDTAQAPVRTIAHWEAAHRNVISDVPQLQSIINNELLYGLALEEDDQLLNGDGTGNNLLGLLNTPGVQVYTRAAGDLKSDALRRSATLSVIANYPGTGFVLHPFDWEDIELQKGTTTNGGDGQYMLFTNIAIGAQAQVWRQPVVETPAMNEGTWLTGAFGLGAQVYDREQANVRIAEQHADFFVRNAIAVLVEERIALAVKRPESFVVGTF
jgi:HK97 family phage major capsid protein